MFKITIRKKIGAPITLNELQIDKKDTLMIVKNAYLTSKVWRMCEKYTVDAIK
ncbi:hypothetical protein ACFLSE_00695 [Bacteroidota bacterium]